MESHTGIKNSVTNQTSFRFFIEINFFPDIIHKLTLIYIRKDRKQSHYLSPWILCTP